MRPATPTATLAALLLGTMLLAQAPPPPPPPPEPPAPPSAPEPPGVGPTRVENRTEKLAFGSKLWVKNRNGSIRVTGWAKEEVALKAEIRDLDRGGLDLSLLGLTDEFLTDLFEPGQMAKAFDRGALEEAEQDGEPEYRNESRFPVTVILDAAEFARWDALKEKKGMSDKRLLLHLLEEK